MPVYLNENFDSTAVGSLPTGWSSLNGTAAVSNTVSYSGANSLKLTGSGSTPVYAWLASATDNNYGLTQASMKFYIDSTPTASITPFLHLLCTSAPGGLAVYPPYSQNAQISLYSGDTTGVAFYHAATDGTTNTVYAGSIANSTFSTTWATATWYNMTLLFNWSLDGIYPRTSLFVQRMSDNAWLGKDGSWLTGVQRAVLSMQTGVGNYNASWLSGTFVAFGAVMNAGVNLYIDDCVFQSAPAPAGASPATPPAAGNEVELIATLSTSDAGQTNHTSSKINDGTPTDCYISTGAYDQYVLLDAGVGVTATPTALLYSPGWLLGTTFTTLNCAVDVFSLGMQLEGANASTGPWTLIGTTPTSQFALPQQITQQRLDPTNPGGTYRYFRFVSHLDPCAVSQVYLHVQNSGGVSWKPARPALSPAAGRLLAGSTVTITTNTSGALIYYTTDGTTPSVVSGVPQGTTTLYTGPVVLPSNAPNATVLQAIAYHASGTTTNSAVTTGNFVVGNNNYMSFDTGVTGATMFGTAFSHPQTFPLATYDATNGWPMQVHDGNVIVDGNNIYQFGHSTDVPWSSSGNTSFNGIPPRGIWLYQGVSIQGAPPWLNFQPVGQIVQPVPPHLFFTAGTPIYNQSRPKILVNPSPINPNRKYVLWNHIGGGNTATNGYIVYTAPAISGPWTAQGQVTPGNLGSYGDSYLFIDPATGFAWIIFKDSGNCYFYQLDSTTDWTTVTATSFTLSKAGAYEGYVVFYLNGYYYLIASLPTAYGVGDSGMVYLRSPTFSATGWANAATLWAATPPTYSVAYSAQSYGIFQVPNLSAPGFFLLLTIQDAYESTVRPDHMYQCWLPLSSVAQGSATNAFPGPLGAMSVQTPASFDATYLPGGTTIASSGGAVRIEVIHNW